MTSSYNQRDWTAHPSYFSENYKSTHLRSPTKAPIKIEQTNSELTAPSFFPLINHAQENDLTKNGAVDGQQPLGERIVVTGSVVDENGKPQSKFGNVTHLDDIFTQQTNTTHLWTQIFLVQEDASQITTVFINFTR